MTQLLRGGLAGLQAGIRPRDILVLRAAPAPIARGVQCRTAQHDEPSTVDVSEDASQLVGSVAFDPEGLFKAPPLGAGQMGGLIERKERERAERRAAAAAAAAAAAQVAAAAPAASPPADFKPAEPLLLSMPPGHRPVVPLPADLLAAHPSGAPIAALPPALRDTLAATLRTQHMAVELSYPGLRVLHLDPPVLAVDHFLTHQQCDRMVAAAEASGRMVGSRIGAGNVSSAYSNAASSRRTSTGMMVTPGVAGPDMDAVVLELQRAGKRLLCADQGPAWGFNGLLPKASQYCYESIQVARYDRGQHFLAHEDGFPEGVAATNGFQRHATLLVYLNDVAQGGATRFNYLDLAMRPAKGSLLLFFPAFADGTSDLRSLHTAEDAVDTKYVTQQWVARGLPKPSKPAAPVPAAAAPAPTATAAGLGKPPVAEARVEKLEKVKKKGGAGKGAKKGFGK